MSLTKECIARSIHKNTAINIYESKKVVDVFFELIKNCLTQNEAIYFRNLGTFKLMDKKERRGRNPQTGDPMILSPRRVVVFKVMENFKKEFDKKGVGNGGIGPENEVCAKVEDDQGNGRPYF